MTIYRDYSSEFRMIGPNEDNTKQFDRNEDKTKQFDRNEGYTKQFDNNDLT